MTDIASALNELGINEWVLRGEPTSEAEFNEMFRKVTGADDNRISNSVRRHIHMGCHMGASFGQEDRACERRANATAA